MGVKIASVPVQHLFSATMQVGESLLIPRGPLGSRAVVGGQGTFHGDRLRGDILPSPGGDWLTLGKTCSRADVRLVLRTHDDSVILMSYQGLAYFRDNQIFAKTTPLFSPRFLTSSSTLSIGTILSG